MNTCQHCGQNFNPKPQTKGLFCSRTCWRASEAAAKPALECMVCGKTFRIPPRDVKRDQKCCSAKCGRIRFANTVGRIPIEERFWGLVDKTDSPENTDGCWLWTGGTARRGYGNLFTERSKPLVMAHKFSYELAYGPVPKGVFVLHRCDVPSCVRPDHLFLGDALVNARDCAAKDRTAHGGRNPKAKLTEEQAIEIAGRCANGESQSHIALDYGVSQSTISQIRLGKTWRRVTRADR